MPDRRSYDECKEENAILRQIIWDVKWQRDRYLEAIELVAAHLGHSDQPGLAAARTIVADILRNPPVKGN